MKNKIKQIKCTLLLLLLALFNTISANIPKIVFSEAPAFNNHFNIIVEDAILPKNYDGFKWLEEIKLEIIENSEVKGSYTHKGFIYPGGSGIVDPNNEFKDIYINCENGNNYLFKVTLKYVYVCRPDYGTPLTVCDRDRYNPVLVQKTQKITSTLTQSIPTKLKQVQSTECINGDSKSIQFETNLAEGENIIYRWYKDGNLFSTTNSIFSPFVTVKNGTEISVTHESSCRKESSFKTIAINLTSIPPNSTTTYTKTCNGGDFIITGSSSTSEIEWFENSSATVSVDASYISNNGKTVKYPHNFGSSKVLYHRSKQGSCVSALTPITLSPYENPSVGTILGANDTFCQGTNAEFTAQGNNVKEFEWYTGPELLASQKITTGLSGTSKNKLSWNTTDIPVGNNKKLYIRAKSPNGCYSDVKELRYNISGNSGTVSTVSGTNYCIGETVNIELSSNSSTSYEWFLDQDMNIAVSTTLLLNNGKILRYAANTVETKKYYFRGKSAGGCYTPLESITVKVNGTPSDLTITGNGQSVCLGDRASFSAGATNANSYKFWKNAAGTIPYTGASGNTLNINTSELELGNHEFWYQAFNSSGCSTEIKKATFTIKAKPTSLEWSGDTEYCTGDTILITPSALNNDNGFEWAYDSNFTLKVEANKIKGNNLEFTAAEVETRNYYVRAVSSSGCQSDYKEIRIKTEQGASNLEIVGDGQTVCKGTLVQIQATGDNVSQFDWHETIGLPFNTGSDTGISILGNKRNTLHINTDKWAVGSYEFYLTARAESGCISQYKKFTLTIKEGFGQTTVEGATSYCLGERIEFNLLNSTSGLTYHFYNDNLGNSPLNSSYINGTSLSIPSTDYGVGSKAIYYRVSNSNGCESEMQSISFEIKEQSTNLEVTNNNSIVCKGDEIIFEASAENVSNFGWYKNVGLTLVAEPEYVTGTKNYRLTIPTTGLDEGNYIYYLVAENSNGCSTQALEIKFEVKGIPGETSISNVQQQYCQYDKVQLSAFNSSAISYEWFEDENGLIPFTEGIITNFGSNIEFEATTSGNTTLYVRAKNISGCFAPMKAIALTILSAPNNITVTSSKPVYCEGDTVELVAGASDVNEFLWYEDNAGTVLIDQIYLDGANNERYSNSGLSKGTYTYYVRAKNSSGCETPLTPVSFKIENRPAINTFEPNSYQYQLGESINFVMEANNFDRYRILKDGNPYLPLSGWIESTTNGIVNITNSATSNHQGIYTLEVSNGTCNSEKNVEIHVLGKVVKITHNRTNLISGGKIQLPQHEYVKFESNITDPTYKHEWIYGDGFENDTEQGVHYFNIPGTYNVKLNLINTITGGIVTYDVETPVNVIESDHVQEIDQVTPPEDGTITLYPVPVKTRLSLKFNATAGERLVFRIYTLNGLVIFVEQTTTKGGEQTITWNNPLGKTSEGVYIAEIVIGNKRVTKKIVKSN